MKKSETMPRVLGVIAGLSLFPFGALQAQEEEDRFSIMLGGSMTGAGDVEYLGATLGEVEATRYHIEGNYLIPFGEEWMFQIGGEYDHLEVDHSFNGSLIPEDLSKIALNLGARWNYNERWAFSGSISPGFYGDDEVDFSDAFNAPLTLLGHWQKNDSLSVALGLRVNAFSDSTVMPVLSVGWEISPEWKLTLGVPRTELRHEWSERLSLFGGVALEGGSYAVDNPSLVTPSGRPLRDTYVSESEMRGLLGFDYKFDSGVKLSVEGGYAFERSFDYHEQNVELEVDPGAFGAVSVSFSF